MAQRAHRTARRRAGRRSRPTTTSSGTPPQRSSTSSCSPAWPLPPPAPVRGPPPKRPKQPEPREQPAPRAPRSARAHRSTCPAPGGPTPRPLLPGPSRGGRHPPQDGQARAHPPRRQVGDQRRGQVDQRAAGELVGHVGEEVARDPAPVGRERRVAPAGDAEDLRGDADRGQEAVEHEVGRGGPHLGHEQVEERARLGGVGEELGAVVVGRHDRRDEGVVERRVEGSAREARGADRRVVHRRGARIEELDRGLPAVPCRGVPEGPVHPPVSPPRLEAPVNLDEV